MRKLARCSSLFFFAFIFCHQSRGEDAPPWLVRDAPYRAVIKLQQAPRIPDAGVEIQLPEFGQMRSDLADALLLDSKGHSQAISAVWRGEGQQALLLAKELKPGETYDLYFGGNENRSMQLQKWTPKISLLMETRRLPEGAKFDSWQDMQKTWGMATDVDGAGFVNAIYQGGNPFGESANFVTHYTGWLQTNGLSELLLYTLSSDASFVLVGDRFEFAWPGIHSPRTDSISVHSKKVSCPPDFVKIDYYHAKVGDNEPATVLGWQQDGKFKAIPPEAWLHPGVSQVLKIEEARGWPVPIVKSEADSYIGYGGRWFYDTKFSLPDAKLDGWTAQWQFDDGAVFTGAECRRVIVDSKAHMVTVKLTRGVDETHGIKRFSYPEAPREASIRNPSEVDHYLGLLGQETPAQLSVDTLDADLILLRDFGTDEQMAKFAEAWLNKNPNPDGPFWITAQLVRLGALAQTDAKLALDELRGIDLQVRAKYEQQFDMLELDLLVFYPLNSPVEELAKRIEFQNPNSETARLAEIRVGDFYRLTDHYKQAIEQYQNVQKLIVDDSAGRKLPAQDQAYSITIRDLIGRGRRREAMEKLREWELAHPMAKFDSDYLLLRGRALNLFGRWNEAIEELDSFKKVQHDSPYVIDADFYRAQALDGLGKKDEARKIWNEIAHDYPKHELAAPSRDLASKP